MTNSQRRIALLTGASITALGVVSTGFASPAFAAPHDTATPNTYYPGGSTSNDIAICNINPAPGTCFYGYVAEGTPTAIARVDTTAEGQIRQQHVGTTALVLSNNSSAEVGAIATVTGTPAVAIADATLRSAIYQSAWSGTAISVTLDNGAAGNLLIDASANAVGVTAATADARIGDYGFHQNVFWAGTGSAVINNAGTITVAAVAHATADGAARAHAGIVDIATGFTTWGASYTYNNGPDHAIAQFVTASTAANAIVNNDAGRLIALSAIASANGGTFASATAELDGLYQQATALNGAAVASVDNSGTFNVHASAFADAQNTAGTAGGPAIAEAYVSYGISQVANGNTASAIIHNGTAGVIDIGAVAHATGTAAHSVTYGWSWGTANNHGAIAGINDGLQQDANAGTYTVLGTNFAGDALALVSNDGIIDIHASATANGTVGAGGGAFASADINNGIEQDANANGGNATASVVNTHSIDITAVANASGTAVTGVAGTSSWGYYAVPGAHANIDDGIDQRATANAVVTATVLGVATGALYGDALVSVNNDGAINIAASADANGTAGRAWAEANIQSGIDQDAFAYSVVLGTGATAVNVGGDASAVFSNAGTLASLDVIANANATGTVATATADINEGIDQRAYSGAGNATADIENSGAISISAIANASGTADAYANAEVSGISQDAEAPRGVALVTLANSGLINIDASAHAAATNTNTTTAANPYANASIDHGISQSASGATATANLINAAGGTIDIGAVARATATAVGTQNYGSGWWGGTANFAPGANAYIGDGLRQNASAGTATDVGGNALANIVNDGAISIHATASANATAGGGGLAIASAEIADGIEQDAYSNGGNATASLSNSNSIDILAVANASGNTVDATAYSSWGWSYQGGAHAAIGTGIDQNATANAVVTGTLLGVNTAAVYGDALVSLNNSGSIHIGASAHAIATGVAHAIADVGVGVDQSANAYGVTLGTGTTATLVGGDAMVTLTNTSLNSLDITAIATATGTQATASASIGTGINQYAFAAAGDATVMINNPGAINITALANAHGTNQASARAVVDGIYQQAVAPNGVASASINNAGMINVHATANADAANLTNATANATVDVDAYAYISYGISQNATGQTSALVTLNNSGTIDIAANATAIAPGVTVAGSGAFSATHAVYPEADARAVINLGLGQSANAYNFTSTVTTNVAGAPTTVTYNYTYGGAANAVDTMVNNGTINIVAHALASAADASASATIYQGITQYAQATGGSSANASANLVNGLDGGINIIALATANGQTNANASASVGTGIRQRAYANSAGTGNAAVSLANSGAILIAASANAADTGVYFFNSTPLDGDAYAQANIGVGIGQYASVDAHYLQSSVVTTGVPTSLGGFTTTTVYTYQGAGTATIDLTNSGSIDILANANATGGSNDGVASAYATIDTGIIQDADVDAATGADATVTIGNTGTINILANAEAQGSDFAWASASVQYGISQIASASATAGSANAVASLTNDNSIVVGAAATATGSGAWAVAHVESGIFQYASATGTAGAGSALLSNAGDLAVVANASANAAIYSAWASAEVEYGIYQSAYGVDAALASVVNTADANLMVGANAFASAQTDASATAVVGGGIYQFASATGTASALIANNGDINVYALAYAFAGDDGSAYADASIGAAIYQQATGGASAVVGFANVGNLNVNAVATASGDEDASAYANIGTVVYQSANAASSSGNASINLTNSGSLSGLAYASALGGGDVTASATIDHGVLQYAAGGVSGTGNATFVNNGPFSMVAFATALGGGDGYANASASGLSQSVYGGAGAVASASNTNTFDVDAVAHALVGNAAHRGAGATASAQASGIHQYANAGTFSWNSGVTYTTGFTAGVASSVTMTGVNATATGGYTAAPSGPATAELTNSGTISVIADASAVADNVALAYAGATAVSQGAAGTDALAFVSNAGTAAAITAVANAFASGQNGASATANAYGILQRASAASVGYQVTLHSTVTLHKTATGTTAYPATATAATVNFTTTPVGTAVASVVNEGSINVSANASALVGQSGPAIGSTTTTPAFASAYALGIGQNAHAADALASVDNSGSIDVNAGAFASGAVTSAQAYAAAQGIVQGADSVGNSRTVHYALGTVTGITFSGHAFTNTTLLPTATTTASTNVGVAKAQVINSGSIDVAATASAIAGSAATAVATATGILQVVAGATASAAVSNTTAGSIAVGANAFASGTAAYASANAIGVEQIVSGPNSSVNDVNAGVITVTANATGVGTTASAYAHAQGFVVSAPATTTTTVVGTVTTTNVNGQPIGGSITNSGTLNVVAFASGGGSYTTLTTAGAGTAVTTLYRSAATATGIRVDSGVNNMTITNSGSINVDAITVNGGPATAYGIRVEANGDATATASDVLTINNSGDIIVRVSTDGGTTFHRGQAIDVTQAPNPVVINLMGGNIYGNIDLQSDADSINVTTAETVFNGVINSYCMPAGGPTALVLDDEDQNDCGVGTLNINSGGNLHLVIDPVDGPSYVFMDTLNMGDDGTIEFDLPSSNGGTVPIGTYPQVFVNVANLDGTLIANIPTPANGLFDDTIYENVIDASGTGQLPTRFDECIINGVPANSLLISGACVYDNMMNVDIGLTRTAFDAVPGLNGNGTAVGSGLECIYDTSLTGGVADMLADLFLFTDPVNYNIALNQLSGSAYANYLQSFPSLGVHYNDLIAKATDCEIPALAGSVLECRASAPIHVWGQLDYQWRKADGDNEAGSTRSKRFTGLLGVDASVGNSAIVGVSAGAVTNNTRDRQFGDNVDASGMQVGLYGVFDPGQFYVKAMTTYSWYDGDSDRNISFAGLAPGATFASSPEGDPDVRMWTFGLHGGYRMGLGGNSVLTPYLNYDYVNAKLKSFTETGGNGADLTVLGGSAKHSFLTGGVKWATQMGGMVPEVNLGYRYRFGEKRSDFRAAFLGDEACDFEIVSAAQKRGTFLAGLSIGGKMGPVDLRIGYEGEFNSDITSHSGNFKFVLPLGGHAAPPPPPPPAPVIAPPPPVEVAPPPPPPPPPPAPVERGERGQ